ncbi:alpha/beta hydrolase [Allorhizobium sp. BGMRC 0089]|uniref:alpha/beta fold hydrolase n=1 Tax=Allorhizobium sonneratiae TaxID=2934936 RepID=UPI002034078B|nr:alpha/beta hydrolase [Allorhizobium sonneratiae]MCM2294372.1 alpha/beta hydrolase [Allorhizobium sonneratiae]
MLNSPNPEWISTGNGPACVMLHGMAMAPSFWQAYTPATLRKGKVAAYPLPGHHPWRLNEADPHFDEDTAVNALSQAIERDFPGQQVTVVGHSTGGLFALMLAIHRPDLVRRIVLMGAFGCGELISRRHLAGRLIGLPLIGALMFRYAFRRWISSTIHFRHGSLDCVYDKSCPWETEESLQAIEAVRTALLASNPLDIEAMVRFITTTSVMDRLNRIEAPVLNLIGMRDAVVPASHQLALSRRLRFCQTVVLRRCGHLPMVEAHDRVTQLLEMFQNDVPIRQVLKKERQENRERGTNFASVHYDPVSQNSETSLISTQAQA